MLPLAVMMLFVQCERASVQQCASPWKLGAPPAFGVVCLVHR
jgi:hypothetical protein